MPQSRREVLDSLRSQYKQALDWHDLGIVIADTEEQFRKGVLSKDDAERIGEACIRRARELPERSERKNDVMGADLIGEG